MRQTKAFTLLELLIVMAVIAVLIAIALPSFRGIQTEALKTKVKTDLNVLALALESYYKDTNSYPNPNPATGDWEDILVQTVPQIMTNKLYDPFNSNKIYCYYLSSGDTYFSTAFPQAGIFGNTAWAAAAGGSPPVPSPSDSYLSAKYYIIWSLGLEGDSSSQCQVSADGNISANEKAICKSNGH